MTTDHRVERANALGRLDEKTVGPVASTRLTAAMPGETQQTNPDYRTRTIGPGQSNPDKRTPTDSATAIRRASEEKAKRRDDYVLSLESRPSAAATSRRPDPLSFSASPMFSAVDLS